MFYSKFVEPSYYYFYLETSKSDLSAIPTEQFIHLTSRELGLLRRDGRGLFLYRGVHTEHTSDFFIIQKAEN
jgi:hypothetical protein